MPNNDNLHYKSEICTVRILMARPIGLKAWPGPRARIEFRAWPISTRCMPKPNTARPNKSSFQGISWNYSIQCWILLNTAYFTIFVCNQSNFNDHLTLSIPTWSKSSRPSGSCCASITIMYYTILSLFYVFIMLSNKWKTKKIKINAAYHLH